MDTRDFRLRLFFGPFCPDTSPVWLIFLSLIMHNIDLFFVHTLYPVSHLLIHSVTLLHSSKLSALSFYNTNCHPVLQHQQTRRFYTWSSLPNQRLGTAGAPGLIHEALTYSQSPKLNITYFFFLINQSWIRTNISPNHVYSNIISSLLMWYLMKDCVHIHHTNSFTFMYFAHYNCRKCQQIC